MGANDRVEPAVERSLRQSHHRLQSKTKGFGRSDRAHPAERDDVQLSARVVKKPAPRSVASHRGSLRPGARRALWHISWKRHDGETDPRRIEEDFARDPERCYRSHGALE